MQTSRRNAAARAGRGERVPERPKDALRRDSDQVGTSNDANADPFNDAAIRTMPDGAEIWGTKVKGLFVRRRGSVREFLFNLSGTNRSVGYFDRKFGSDHARKKAKVVRREMQRASPAGAAAARPTILDDQIERAPGASDAAEATPASAIPGGTETRPHRVIRKRGKATDALITTKTDAITLTAATEMGAMKQRRSFDYSSLSADLAKALATAAQDVRSSIKRTTTTVVEIGNTLIWAKGQLGHGPFLGWLAAEFAMETRTAERYMRAAEWVEDKFDIVSKIEPTTAYLLSARSTPGQLRDQVVQRIRDGEHVPVAEIKTELQRVTRERKRAKTQASVPRDQPTAVKRERQQQEVEANSPTHKAVVEQQAQHDLLELLHARLGERLADAVELMSQAGCISIKEIGRMLASGGLAP
jgi:hypothetical protein